MDIFYDSFEDAMDMPVEECLLNMVSVDVEVLFKPVSFAISSLLFP